MKTWKFQVVMFFSFDIFMLPNYISLIQF